MNMRTRLALSLIISSLPSKTVDVSRVHRMSDKLVGLVQHLPVDGKVDVREVLLSVLDQAS